MARGRQGDRQGDLVGNVEGDAALAGPRLLRPASGGADRRWLRRFRGDDLQAVLCGEDGCAVDSARPLLPDAHGRLLRGDRQRAGDRVALRGLAVAAGVSASADGGAGAGPLLAVEDAEPAAARGPRGGVRLGAVADRRAWSGERRADRRRRLGDGGQRRAADDRAPGDRRDLPGDAEAHGRGERDRDAVGRRSRSHRSRPQGQDAVQRRLGEPDRSRRQDRQDEGRHHASGLQEHAVDLDSGAGVAAEIHPADEGDTTTLSGTLQAAAANLAKVDRAPSTTELVADKGYHSRAVLKDLDGGAWKTRIAEPRRTALLRWHGDTEARNAVYANRNRLRSAVGKQSMRQQAEIVERSFAHNLERGGMRRTWLRGRENVHKRYLIHVAGHNLGILMRLLIGAGTPKEAAARGRAFLFAGHARNTLVLSIFAVADADFGMPVVTVTPTPT